MSGDTATITNIIHDLLNDLKSQIEQDSTSFRSVLEMNTSSDSSESSDTSSSDTESSDLVNNIRKKMKHLHKKSSDKKNIKLLKKNIDSDNDLPNDDKSDDENKQGVQLNQKYLKTKGEMTLDDLEPVVRLTIQLDDTVKLVEMGHVLSIVDEKLIVVQSNHGVKPLNEETILFDTNRRVLGNIYEVFGPVQAPFYSIRFNNVKEITENNLNVERDSKIYYAHDSKEFTKFIFNLDELRKMKGSDASWNNDNEPPTECIDYSDDEMESLAKRQLKIKRQNARKEQTGEDSDDSPEEIQVPDHSQTNQRNSKRPNQNFQTNKSPFRKSQSMAGGFMNNTNNNNYNNQQPDFNNNFSRNNQKSFNNNNNQAMPHSRSFQNYPQQKQQIQNQFMPHIQNQFNPNYNNGMMQQQGPMPNYNNQNWNQNFQNQFIPQNHQQNFYNNQQQQQQQFYQNPNFMQMNNFQNQGRFQNGPPMYDMNSNPTNQSNRRNAPNYNGNSNNNMIDKRFIQDKTNGVIKKSF